MSVTGHLLILNHFVNLVDAFYSAYSPSGRKNFFHSYWNFWERTWKSVWTSLGIIASADTACLPEAAICNG
jgi:hypothetical protein